VIQNISATCVGTSCVCRARLLLSRSATLHTGLHEPKRASVTPLPGRNNRFRANCAPSCVTRHAITRARISGHVRLVGSYMAARGKFIVLEGIDGSGKRTQLEMLARALSDRGVPCEQVSFPNYSGFFGRIVARFLNGEFGPLEAVDPHFSALLYAGDRFESKPKMEAALASGKTLLADRYIGSNLAHQGARVVPDARSEFLEWLRRLEYHIYALPPEDLVIYLHVPVDEAHRLIGQKAARDYTNRRRDLQEADRAHLAGAAEVYYELAHQKNWVRIDCMERTGGQMRSPQSIHDEIISVIAERLAVPAHAVR